MKRFSLKIAVALLTFTVGISASAALLKGSALDINPPEIPTPNDDKDKPSASDATLEMVFVLDTTGSMGGLIEGAKQRIWGIVNEVMQSPAKPSVRVGLVAYRDRGDQYVTQVLPLTNDLDKVYATLMGYRAEGGGDGPENVRRALADGVSQAGWSKAGQRTTQIVFLVGDAPPHEDYANEPDTLKTAQLAVGRGMIVNTIQCGTDPTTQQVWQQIARRGEGQYFAIAQDGGVHSVTTPFDARLSELGSRLGSTFTAYGGGAGTAGKEYREAQKMKATTTEAAVANTAPAPAQADRAYNKALNKDAYIGDLLQDIENGSASLDKVKEEDLPDDLEKLAPVERKAEVEKRLAERKKMRDEIVSLSKQRDEFIAAERKKKAGGQTGFDAAVATALKEQLARKRVK